MSVTVYTSNRDALAALATAAAAAGLPVAGSLDTTGQIAAVLANLLNGTLPLSLDSLAVGTLEADSADLTAITSEGVTVDGDLAASGFVAAAGTAEGLSLTQAGENGALAVAESATELLSAMAGATVTATDLIPAGCLLLGVTVRVTTVITGATSFDVGDGVDPDFFGNDIAVAADTVTTLADATAALPVLVTAATSVVLTAVGSDFLTGAVRVTAHFIRLTAPTS